MIIKYEKDKDKPKEGENELYIWKLIRKNDIDNFIIDQLYKVYIIKMMIFNSKNS